MEILFLELLKISVLCGGGILLIFAVSCFLRKTHTAFWRYCLWVLIGVRLILPFDFSLSDRSVVISLPIRMPAEETISDDLPESGEVSGADTKESSKSEDFLTLQGSKGKTGSNVVGNDGQQGNKAETARVHNGEVNSVNDERLKISDLPNQSQREQQEAKGQERKPDGLNHVLWCMSAVWAAGVMALLVWQTVCYVIFSRKVKRTKVFFGKKEKLSVYRSPVVSSPLLMGIRKPQIVLPDKEYPIEELAFILEHEFTHYKRKDLWAKLLLALAKTLHWFNPLVILMERQAIQDMELLCDGRVVRCFSREEKKQYGTALLNCASTEKSRNTILCTSEFSRDVKTLKKRFANIFNGGGKKKGILAVVLGAFLLLSVSLFVMFRTSEKDAEKVSLKAGNFVSEDTDAQSNEEKMEDTGSGGKEKDEDAGKESQMEEQQEKGQLGDDSLFSLMNTYTWQEITVSIPDAWEGTLSTLI